METHVTHIEPRVLSTGCPAAGNVMMKPIGPPACVKTADSGVDPGSANTPGVTPS
jgi:hypothetical protein